MTRFRATCTVVALTMLAAVGGPVAGWAATQTAAISPTPALPRSLPATSTTTAASSRSIQSSVLTLGARDQLRTDGTLTWAPSTGIRFNSVYQYISGPGPGTPQDYQPYVVVAFAKAAQQAGATPVLSYFRMNGNFWGKYSRPAACQGACTLGDTAKRNLDHLGDPSFMQEYFLGLAHMLKALDTDYAGQLVLHLEPDLSGYGQMLSNDRARCGSACIAGAPSDSPAAVRAAVASSRLMGLEKFPDTMQGFYLATLWLRDRYAPRVSMGFHVSGWATANVFRKSGVDDPTNDVNQGRVPVAADTLAARVAAFAALSGASTKPQTLPGPVTSRFGVLFNDVLDHDAAYAEIVGKNPNYWWDTENVDLPNFHRWEDFVRGITGRTGLKATIWQIPLGNSVFRVQNNTLGHYQDNRAEYLFTHLGELAAAGITGLIFGGGNADSTSSLDKMIDAPDNSTSVCTRRGSHSQALRCPYRNATVLDDDGGYLRERAAAYLAKPLRL